jgi:hypothetical protein
MLDVNVLKIFFFLVLFSIYYFSISVIFSALFRMLPSDLTLTEVAGIEPST